MPLMMREHAAERDDRFYPSLVEKLSPSHLRMSGKMTAIVGNILGQKFTDPEVCGLAISSDGHVTSMDAYIGLASDLERNLDALVGAAELNVGEADLFARLRHVAFDDHRMVESGIE